MRAILDTNVLLAALISPHRPPDIIYRTWQAGRFDLAAGAPQLVELRRAREAMRWAYQAVPCWLLPQWRVCETIPAEIGPLLPRRPWPGCRSPLTVSKEAKVSLRRKTIFAHIRLHEALGPIPPVECRVTQFPGFYF
ncbi:PIN domain-containing protein [Verminephrobacter eiseniae]|uniref:hypothetical protein n=1 Tax=Verminephrobacter eiseniae TaxID=364317 RepID=UPI00223782C6|nr:hypothetical protein [Verminephrobacter eiseniae]